MKWLSALAAAFFLAACAQDEPSVSAPQCDVSLIVLGVAQDAGKPQIGNPNDPAWDDPSLRRLATSLALVDRRGDKPKRWLFDATPDIKEQLHRLNRTAPTNAPARVDGVFLTHAHIGHYAGLMMFGREAAGGRDIEVFAMPRMADFLAQNGPWSQLLVLHNIYLAIMENGVAETIGDDLSVTPFLVPHRQEFSEVVGFVIEGPEKSVLFLPDIDDWEDWDAEGMRIEDKIADVEAAFLDATFYSGDELPGRDMSKIPHPTVVHSMERFAELPDSEKTKVHFIHMNHTNPLHRPGAAESARVEKAGFMIAEEGMEICL
ncbi:MBL fold metallo-hydrolase [Hyphococcus luteus]|uniref:Pyrroloquinoline quinone biosynthesis protein PqqB n=1 Tax=Hyphococcus luteus TaxID=2058213 RepID=A0A2S7K9L1_9PROT|nr:MBL fold metallo-hydrolase [Marinicaulis flavus]PQA89139.1 pyrroloquinoline quinone biosynthesis protein PqqB [Marinicaulis flavus]